MKKSTIDLHIHSNAYDGIFTPTEIVEIANKLRMRTIALTDHDTINGLEEFKTCKNPGNIRRIPGIELSAEHNGSKIHLLGYFVPDNPKHLIKLMHKYGDKYIKQFYEIISYLSDINIEFSSDDIDNVVNNLTFPCYAEVAQLLVKYNIVKTQRDAFTIYFKKRNPAYRKHILIDAVKCIKSMKSDNMIISLAHPLLIEDTDIISMLYELESIGLDGVETYYQYIPKGKINKTKYEMSEHILQAVDDLGLLQTGGSDFHVSNGGNDIGGVIVPQTTVDELLLRHKNIQS